MRKKPVILILCVIIMLLAIVLFGFMIKDLFPFASFDSDDALDEKPDVIIHWEEHPEVPLEERDEYIEVIENAIYTKEMAIQIGRIILEQYFPDEFQNRRLKLELDAEETDGIWKVYALPKRSKNASSFGGGVYVKLRRSGEIVRIGYLD